MTEEKAKKFESDVIWDEVKDLPIEMFSLPNQKVSDHVVKIPLPGKVATVKLKSSSVITSLDHALSRKYDVIQGEVYTTIGRIVERAEEAPEYAEVVVDSAVKKVKPSHK
jgi:hypothetical protein